MVDSNHGKCVDLFAPGVNIPVAGNGGVSSMGNRSGTSFAAPHVTGVAALFLEKNPTAQPAAIWTAILNAANNNDITPATPKWCGIPNRMTGSPNVLLHWGSGSDNGVSDAPVLPGPPPPPIC
jgi:serine protease